MVHLITDIRYKNTHDMKFLSSALNPGKTIINTTEVLYDFTVYNVTINKNMVHIGENITVSTVYSLQLYEGFDLTLTTFVGIEIINGGSPKTFGFYNALSDNVFFQNYTADVSVSPDWFDAGDIVRGVVEFIFFNESSGDKSSFSYWSNNNCLIQKASLHYSLLDQSSLTVFSDETLQFSAKVCNNYTKTYPFSNENISIEIKNEIGSLNIAELTNSEGILNFTINCSLLGAGNYSISLQNSETPDYELTLWTFYITVFDEETSVNCTLLNPNQIYTNVNYDLSNYTKGIYLIQTQFAANVSYYSNFTNGICTTLGNDHWAIIDSPNISGNYQITFIITPIQKGKTLQFDTILEVQKRPISLETFIHQNTEQTTLSLLIRIIDLLVNQSIGSTTNLFIYANYNNSNHYIGKSASNSSGTVFFEWELPQNVLENYISFHYVCNGSSVYHNSEKLDNLTIPKLKYFGPLTAYTHTNITIELELSTLNGAKLSDKNIRLKIFDQNMNLSTNLHGRISYSIITPPKEVNLVIEVEFAGSDGILTAKLIVLVKVRFDFLHQLWNSLGFILLGASSAILGVIYLKKVLCKRDLGVLKVK